MARSKVRGVAWAALLGVALAGACGGRQSSGGAPEMAGQAGQALDGGAAGQGSSLGGTPSVVGGETSHAGEGAHGGTSPLGGETSTAGAGSSGEPGVGLGGDGGKPSSGGDGGSGGDGDDDGRVPGTPIAPGTGTVGSQCAANIDCEAGLQCLTATTLALKGTAPPHGLCTKTCTADVQCEKVSAGAICFPFDSDDSQGYCAEGCTFGEQGLFRKCHARSDFSCMPGLLTDTGYACSSGCFDDEICEDGTCQTIIATCLPACRGDLDCAPGLYCDTSFLAGTCTTKKPTGKKFGQPCTVPGALNPSEPDGCLGFCEADTTGSSAGHCAETCGLSNGCAWDAATQRFDGACYYPSALPLATAVADFGFCAAACDCGAECATGGECYALNGLGELDTARYSGAGICFQEDSSASNPVVDHCQ